mmetsp:Transcript_2131/g.4930  ORF Transcript_2131/g.4930 Transcript_2131/m.4930 type:complete len:245 (+) Transcript_2131:1383-2117(+)
MLLQNELLINIGHENGKDGQGQSDSIPLPQQQKNECNGGQDRDDEGQGIDLQSRHSKRCPFGSNFLVFLHHLLPAFCVLVHCACCTYACEVGERFESSPLWEAKVVQNSSNVTHGVEDAKQVATRIVQANEKFANVLQIDAWRDSPLLGSSDVLKFHIRPKDKPWRQDHGEEPVKWPRKPFAEGLHNISVPRHAGKHEVAEITTQGVVHVVVEPVVHKDDPFFLGLGIHYRVDVSSMRVSVNPA